jgi:hypothetical protein
MSVAHSGSIGSAGTGAASRGDSSSDAAILPVPDGVEPSVVSEPPARRRASQFEGDDSRPASRVGPPGGDDQALLYTVVEAAVLLRISRTSAYQLARGYLASGGHEGLPVIRVGRCLRVPRWALLELACNGRVVRLCELVSSDGELAARSRVAQADRPPRSPVGRRAGVVEQLVLVPGE